MSVGVERANLLFALLPDAERARLTSAGQLRQHESGETIQVRGEPVETLAFPVSGMISITVDVSDGRSLEVAMVGNEGFVGVGRYLGNADADNNGVVQVAGEIWHVEPEAFARAVNVNERLKSAVDRYLNSFIVEIGQSAVCNQTHSVEQRAARWLLHATDRADTTQLRLTHEFLSQMLAVRRATVSTVIGVFSRAGLTQTQRGMVVVADRSGLRELTCECYDVVRKATPRYD